MQAQIDATIAAVLGDRKKYMKKLKDFQCDFYSRLQDITESFHGGRGDGAPKVRPASIPLDSQDTDSDRSVERIAGFFQQLQEDGRLELGGKGDVTNAQVTEMLKRHNDEKLEKVRAKFVDRIPMRRQAMYREDKQSKQFTQFASTKLRVLHAKQIEAVSRLGVYKHLSLANQRRLSGSVQSSTSRLRSQASSKLSINAGRAGKIRGRDSTVDPASPGLAAFNKKKTLKINRKKEMEKEFDMRVMEANSDAIGLAIKGLRNKYQVKVAAEVAEELAR